MLASDVALSVPDVLCCLALIRLSHTRPRHCAISTHMSRTRKWSAIYFSYSNCRCGQSAWASSLQVMQPPLNSPLRSCPFAFLLFYLNIKNMNIHVFINYFTFLCKIYLFYTTTTGLIQFTSLDNWSKIIIEEPSPHLHIRRSPSSWFSNCYYSLH